VKGLDVTLKQALEFKYITAPMSVAEAQGCSTSSISGQEVIPVVIG
jgi:hypothetical protein